jgi:predicted transcriptional regulator
LSPRPGTALGLVIARTIDPLASVRLTTAVCDAHRLMIQRSATALPVLDGTRAVGSISLLTAESLGFEGGATLVRDVLEPPLPELDETASTDAVARAIKTTGAVLILRGLFPLGLLTAADLQADRDL